MKRLLLCAGFVVISLGLLHSQRIYSGHSVLASGNWYKLAVKQGGIFKIDLAFLTSLGINTSNLSSSSIRLFGNGGLMLPENCNGFKYDDLVENSIWVEDGGDGILNGSDYILFYANGPDEWIKDSLNQRFSHRKNLYSSDTYYYITIGGNGKRVQPLTAVVSSNTVITAFNERYFYELDTFNFLSSGKQWFGDEFSSLPGRLLSRTYNIPLLNILNEPAILITNLLARSFNVPGNFSVRVNNNQVGQLALPPVASGPYDQFASIQQSVFPIANPGADLSVTFNYVSGSFNSQGWLEWFEIHSRRRLSFSGVQQLSFRDWRSVSQGNIGEFIIQNAVSAARVWEITDPLNPVKMNETFANGELRFRNDCSFLREYIAFSNTALLIPVAIGRVTNQDLHGDNPADYLIVVHKDLLSQAQRIAQLHQQRNGLRSVIVTTEQVYNEFSSGSPDPSAIRDFVKMYYDRAGSDTTKRPRYLLLFGDASFDYKDRIRGNTNLVPAYQSVISLDPLATYTSDDFFGFLDDGDDINSPSINLIDIGIGRIPAKNADEAKSIVDKIIHYHESASMGPWRNEFTFVGDDEDANLHLDDAEVITKSINAVAPVFNNNKVYLDTYQQQSGAGGSRYPEANSTINNKILSGNLIWNFNGHGSFRRLAEEVVLDQEIINTFNNPDRLPLFITATCDFAPYDNPLVSSIGENLLLRPKTGSIALMTTTRVVFAFSNRVMNKNYLDLALQRRSDGTYPSLGEAVRAAKNYTYTFFGDPINNRKFTLLGDPAMTLAFPVRNIRTISVNGNPSSSVPDTLRALGRYSIEGEITDQQGNRLQGFNGTVYPVVFDKVKEITTKGNDPSSIKIPFSVQNNIIYKGKAKVANGIFSFDFLVPKDINYQFGNGKISYYAEDGTIDGNGLFTNFIVGGSADSSNDNKGPDIRAFLNDEKFVSGGISNDQPILLLRLSDSSGINVIGNGIGHDLELTIDNDPAQKFVLNEYYESELDDFRKGLVRFQLPKLTDGLHTLQIKAWDAANNSNEAFLEFRVEKPQDFVLSNVLNYPNPFTTNTTFWFDHNCPGEELKVHIQIFTVTGKLVKTLRSTIISTGNRSSEVVWDGRDDYGSKIGRGVYIYRLKVQTSDGKTVQKLEKLYML